MPNLKDIKTRITSVKKTRQITSAMKLVAAAKLKGATERATAAQPYQARLREVLANVAERAGESATDPLLERPATVKRALVVVFTSDRGLCGGFNNNLMRRLLPWVEAKQADGVEVEVRVYGRKGRDFSRSRGLDLAEATVDYANTPRMDLVRPLGDLMVSGFTGGAYDEVWLAYNSFINAATQKPGFHRILPMQVETDDAGAAAPASSSVDYLYEPGPAQILGTLLPLYLRTLLLQAFLETEAGEFGARMLAMDNATRNANDLISDLSLQYNRARQAAITTEITEIVSGAEAL